MNKITKENLFRDRFVLGKSWNKTYAGYFSDKKVLNSFANIILKLNLPKKINVLYACSGNGLLGEYVCTKLKYKGHEVNLTLVDISREHLKQNHNKETKKICKDILEFKPKTKYNLIIMRSSLDYFHKESLQVKVLKRIKSFLIENCFFVNQCASMPTNLERDLADKIYASNNKIGRRHFQGQDVFKIYKKAGFGEMRLLKEAPIMMITEKEHVERYKFSKDEVAKVKKIISNAKEFKHPNIKNTKKGYVMKFHFPIYLSVISNKNNIIIDYAKTSDILFLLKGMKEICKLEKQKPDPDKIIIGQIKKAIKKNEIKVARLGNSQVGFVQFRFTKKSPYGFDYGPYKKTFCWIDWMYVTTGNRRKKIGDLLYHEVLKICKKKGVKELMLDVFDVNKSARKFYKKEHFNESIHILEEKIK